MLASRLQACGPASNSMLTSICAAHCITRAQDDAPEGCWSKLKWLTCNTAHRRTIGSPDSEGKVYVRCYNDIPLADLDMMFPGSKPNPKLLDALIVLVPFLAGFGSGIYKIVSVRDASGAYTSLRVRLWVVHAPGTVP
jgi:Protein of unknown function (DUF3754)